MFVYAVLPEQIVIWSDIFLPDPLQFVIQQSYYHWNYTVCNTGKITAMFT
jgi:hypothetical protein